MDNFAENATSEILPARINDYRIKVDNAILSELNKRKDSVCYKCLTNAIKGGKRLRPILLILSFECVNGQGVDPYPAAVAMELIHLESLIHDDIIDRDSLRRENASFHALYGHEMALLSADFILSMILDITARYMNPRATRTLALAASRLCEGEFKELMAYKNKQTLNEDIYLDIISKKTAALFEASAKIGAIIGGATEDNIQALSDYARLLGTAYQIRDDISDWEKSSTEILSLLDINLDKIPYLQEIFASYIREAKKKLEKLKPSDAKDLLIQLADFIS
jgi:octaprenyl-diphosphate synthase